MSVFRAQHLCQRTRAVALRRAEHCARRPCTGQCRHQAYSFVRAQSRSIEESNVVLAESSCGADVQTLQVAAEQEEETCREAPVSASWTKQSAAAVPLFLAPLFVGGGTAFAATQTAYSPSSGGEVFKTAAGAAYVVLVCIFFYRLLRKRATTGTTQNYRSQIDNEVKQADAATVEKEVQATPLGALWGAVQAGVICFFLFQLCGLVDGYFTRQELPEQYTAHNITVTLRTVVRGLSYLMTFLFGVNCVGLSGLALQLLFFPEADKQLDVEQNEQS